MKTTLTTLLLFVLAAFAVGSERVGPQVKTQTRSFSRDLNRDGRLDIVVEHVELPGSIYFNLGSGRFREIAWNDGKGVVYGIAFADLNGDGWPDIIAARSDAPNGIWFSTEAKRKLPLNTTR